MSFKLFVTLNCFLKLVVLANARQFRVTDQIYFDIENEEKPLGRVVVGLFGDLAPRAVKNFKVLATNGINGKSYKGTGFNHIIKRFMVQASSRLFVTVCTPNELRVCSREGSGDFGYYRGYCHLTTHSFQCVKLVASLTAFFARQYPSGGDVVNDDGTGSISIYGKFFDDENLDTQHTMAGFVSMANKGRNTNGCQFIITTTGTPWLDQLHTVVGRVIEGQNVIHMVEHTPTDVDDRPTRRVFIADSGILPTPQPFYISDDPYDLWSWIKASAAPLTMSFSILGFFHWMIRKMDI